MATPGSSSPPDECDVAVVGGGIVGLAVARELCRRGRFAGVAVLEKERELACHQTAHSSGVIHAGIYYAPGSLKARLCVAGARELYELCAEHGIAAERSGKLIVASDASELAALDELERRGRANGVPGLRRLDAAGIRELEPHARGVAALHSPATGVTDFKAVAEALAAGVVGAGGAVMTSCEVRGARTAGRRIRIEHRLGETRARQAVFCAGASADRLAVAAGGDPDPRIVPFRGFYLRLRPERRELVRSMIYPVPDPRLPFLGVHLTRTLGGEVLIGPTALLAPARDAYRLSKLNLRDLASTLAWPGTWRLVRRHWRSGVTELERAVSRKALVAEACRFVPELRTEDAEPAFAGVRAQALRRDGRLEDDFVLTTVERALHLRNAPSPAATSALAIARLVVDRLEGEPG